MAVTYMVTSDFLTHISTMFDEHLHTVDKAPAAGLVQWSDPIASLGVDVRTPLDQSVEGHHLPRECRGVELRPILTQKGISSMREQEN